MICMMQEFSFFSFSTPRHLPRPRAQVFHPTAKVEICFFLSKLLAPRRREHVLFILVLLVAAGTVQTSEKIVGARATETVGVFPDHRGEGGGAGVAPGSVAAILRRAVVAWSRSNVASTTR